MIVFFSGAHIALTSISPTRRQKIRNSSGSATPPAPRWSSR